MPKLKFTVCHSVGEDPDYPVNELNVHSPQTKGWQSPRFCEYPCEIGLQFNDGTVRIQQIQLLAHQSKIATRVEIFMGTGDEYATATFQRLGYLSLDNNDRSGFRARELKSVYIDATGQFLKLCMHKCFINKYNLYNQVGLIAINALGESLGKGGTSTNGSSVHSMSRSSQGSYDNNGGRSSNNNNNVAQPNEKLNDLAFDMAFDAETADKIRNISAAKNACVANEDYEAAKALKTVEQQMKAIGVQLAKMEVQKNTAVQREDYDAASSLKLEINRLRSGIEGRLNNIPAYEAFLDDRRAAGNKGNASNNGLFRPPSQQRPPQPQQSQQPQQPQQPQQLQQSQQSQGEAAPPNQLTKEQQDIMRQQQELERQRKQLEMQQEMIRQQAEQQKAMLDKQQLEMQRQMHNGQQQQQDAIKKVQEDAQEAARTAQLLTEKNAKLLEQQQLQQQQQQFQQQMMQQQMLQQRVQPGGQPGQPMQQQQQPPQQQQQQPPPQQQQQQQQPPLQQQQSPPQQQPPPQQHTPQQLQQQQTNPIPTPPQQQQQQQPPQQREPTPQPQQNPTPDPFKSSNAMKRDGLSMGAAGIAARLAVQPGVRRTPPQGAKRGEVTGGTGLPGSPVRRTAPPMVLAPGELHPLAGVPGYEDLVDPEPIAPAMLTEAKELGNVFGHYVIQCFYSKTWQLREAALLKFILDMPRILNQGILPMNELFVLTCRMLQMCASERVANVFSKSIDFLKLVLTGVAASIHREEVTRGLETYTKTLVEKLGNSNARVRNDANSALMAMARSNSVGPAYIAVLLLKKPKKELPTAYRPILGRMTTLQSIIEEFGFFRDLSMDAIMSHLKVCNAFAHGKDQVRDMARNITVACYQAFGDDVRNHLNGLRPKQMEEYENAFNGSKGGNNKGGNNKGGNNKGGARKKPRQQAKPNGQNRGGGGGGGGGGSGGGGGDAQDNKKRKARKGKQNRNDVGNDQNDRDIEVSSTQNQDGGQRLTISNAAGDGRDININLTVQASPTKRGGAGGGGGLIDDAVDDAADDNPFTCQFCGRYDPNFTEDMLDMHYWKECPCLTSCTFCGQVVEIMTMNTHLLEECEKRGKFGKGFIADLDDNMDKCSLCQIKVSPLTESGWKQHLLRGKGCPKNPRTGHLRKKQTMHQ